MSSYKNIGWIEVKHLYDERSTPMLIMDVISIIPLDGVYYSLSIANMKIIYALRMRYLCRIFRFLNRIHRLRNTVGYNNLLVELLCFSIFFITFLILSSSILYFQICHTLKCSYKDINLFTQVIYAVSGEFTFGSYETQLHYTILTLYIFVVIKFLAFLYLVSYTIGNFTIATIEELKVKYVFGNIKRSILQEISKYQRVDPILYSTCKLFFNLFWKNRKGSTIENFGIKIIPEIMAKEISLDIIWDAFKHSHLFRKRETHLLRYIAPLVKQKFMIPGEVIYKRNHFKSCMIYVVSGIIQILSEEDGETPILSFSGGTCLGESTLLVDYPSTCTVICQSYSEVNILYRKDFMKVFLKYPKECRDMLHYINKRYSETKHLVDILKPYWVDKNEELEMLTLRWLKTSLHYLIDKNKQMENEVKRVIKQTNFKNIAFCTEYLDLMVIAEKIELVTDTVFLRTTCPCLLRPNSFIVLAWNYIVITIIFILIIVYPYYASFQPQTSSWYIAFSYLVTLLWWIDIYITLSTAVKTKDRIITETLSIAMWQLKTYSFALDTLAALPIELMVLFVTREIHSQTIVLLQILRLFKIYRIKQLFDGSLCNVSAMTEAYLKNFIYLLIAIYFMAAVMYLKLCYKSICDTDNIFINYLNIITSGEIEDVVLLFIYFIIQQINSVMSIFEKGSLSSLFSFLTFLNIFITLCYIRILSYAATIETLNEYNSLQIQDYINKVLMVMHILNIRPELYNEVVKYIRAQLQFNNGCALLYTFKTINNYLHPVLLKEFHYLSYGRTIKSVSLFSELTDEIIAHMASVFQKKLFGPGEVITYSGEVCKEMYIIQSGICKMTEFYKESKTTFIGPGSSISVIEICLKRPVMNTVVTITHCQLLTVSHEQLMKAFRQYPKLLLQIKEAANFALSQRSFYLSYCNNDVNVSKLPPIKQKSFKNFGYRLAMDTKEGKDYHNYFDKLGIFGYIRYILLRHIITSYGLFIYYWEALRCFFAFLTAILSPISTVSTCTDCSWWYILLFLDITAWIDIYVRHHISYFNYKGIEITHPLQTATYYWKHGLLIDLLGVIPLEYLYPTPNNVKGRQIKVFLKTLRVLQIHRLLNGVRYLKNDFISPSKAWIMIKYMPFIVVFINTIGSIIINQTCVFHPSIKETLIFSDGVECTLNTWLTKSKFAKPLTPIRSHLYGLFFTTVVLSGPGLGGFHLTNREEVLLVTILTLIGFWVYLYLSAKIIAKNWFKNVDLTLYQESMYNIVKFLSYRQIDTKLKDEVISHFEYIWHKKKGKNLNKIIAPFNYALQADILFDVYGISMKKSSIFAKASNSFFRSLLLNIKHEIVINRGIVCRVNDINENMYFIYSGQVEVLGADYNRLLILPKGSLFGNLDNHLMTRQTLTMVGKGHVEVLCIKTATFFSVLNNYHNLKVEYLKLIAINTDYIVDSSMQHTSKQAEVTEYNISAPTKILNKIKESFAWEISILMFVCYFGSILQLYQLTVYIHTWIIILLLYCMDVLYILNIYLNFHTRFENEYGILITDRKQIASRYLKAKTGFFLDLASTIPIEILSLIFIKSQMFWKIWSYCRCNRFIRMFFVISYFQARNQQLNINVTMMRTVQLIVWTSLILQGLTTLLIKLCCLTPKLNIYPTISCDWKNITPTAQFGIYLQQFDAIVHIFTKTFTSDYFPNSPYLIVFFICLIITCKLLSIIFIAEVAATLEIILHNRTEYEEYIQALKEYMTRERTSPPLLNRIWLYLQLLWRRKRGLQFPNLLEEAPYYLKEGILNSMFGYHLRKHPIFRSCHTDLIRQMSAQMRPRTFFPGDYITFIKDADNCMYFIHEGSVDALSEDTMYQEIIDKVLNAGDMFGFQQGLYLNYGHVYTYRANIFTVVVILERKNWIYLLDFFPASKQLLFNTKKD